MSEQDIELLKLDAEYWRLRAMRAEKMLKDAGVL